GDGPESGTRIAVVGDELHFEPFSSEAELLLRRLATASAQGLMQTSHPQQQQRKEHERPQADSGTTNVTTRSGTLSASAVTCTAKTKGTTTANSVDTATATATATRSTSASAAAAVSNVQRTTERAASFGGAGSAEQQVSDDGRRGRHGDSVRQSPEVRND
ncbi:hypothetical protein Vretimale_10520, partial [Volvox reticuliferus]